LVYRCNWYLLHTDKNERHGRRLNQELYVRGKKLNEKSGQEEMKRKKLMYEEMKEKRHDIIEGKRKVSKEKKRKLIYQRNT
jgi:hypothetical protein